MGDAQTFFLIGKLTKVIDVLNFRIYGSLMKMAAVLPCDLLFSITDLSFPCQKDDNLFENTSYFVRVTFFFHISTGSFCSNVAGLCTLTLAKRCEEVLASVPSHLRGETTLPVGSHRERLRGESILPFGARGESNELN